MRLGSTRKVSGARTMNLTGHRAPELQATPTVSVIMIATPSSICTSSIRTMWASVSEANPMSTSIIDRYQPLMWSANLIQGRLREVAEATQTELERAMKVLATEERDRARALNPEL